MCDHTNDPGGREAAMVVLDPGTPERHGRDGVWCDPCLVPLVKALNDGGVRTIASCCGHGKVYGSIALADGRWLTIMPDADWRAWDARINQAQIDAQEPAGAPGTPPEGVGTSRTLSDRLRALIPATYADDGYFGVTALEIGEFADEAHRLEVHARVVEQSLRTARAEGDGARIKAEQWKARYEETRDANRRVLQVAQWFRGQGQTGYARKVEEAVGGVDDEHTPVVTIPTLYARIHLCTTCTTCDTIPCICDEVPRG